ncbi:MAG: hypothetical protein A2571_02680 [Candidatus Vogelbacteria bacterium RIFOXYD1_FULL_44_32]|uniref:Uncharacterized protein n=1 Tax=Candidatus Vogelbacteria bacterium RIFOXYD1_FULL_44_32 TaxID=1802438 RepID=A0A1G2QDJ0_9BACT|nr:MAG: hypothetical protein A2571_02680 [Candidatus Vogelbacteria bacterium RIFOXYD1_FULL_44_32]
MTGTLVPVQYLTFVSGDFRGQEISALRLIIKMRAELVYYIGRVAKGILCDTIFTKPLTLTYTY